MILQHWAQRKEQEHSMMQAGRNLLLAWAMTLASVAGAETVLPAPEDFSARRVKVGDALPGKRITVQIDPAEQARILAALPKVEARAATLEPQSTAPALPVPAIQHARDTRESRRLIDPPAACW